MPLWDGAVPRVQGKGQECLVDVLPSLWLGVHVSEKRDLLQKAEGARGADPSLPASKEYSVSLWLVAAPMDTEPHVSPRGKVCDHLARHRTGLQGWPDGRL